MRGAVLVAVVAMPLPACAGDCPGQVVELRPFTGASVEGTSITCEGELPSWAACTPDAESHMFFKRPGQGCDHVMIGLGQITLIGETPALALDGTDVAESARVEILYYNDVPGPIPPQPVLLDGFVMVQELSRSGRNRGRFELHFEGGSVAGSYDAPGLP